MRDRWSDEEPEDGSSPRLKKSRVVHVTEKFGPNFSKEFMSLAKRVRFVVYGGPTEELN